MFFDTPAMHSTGEPRNCRRLVLAAGSECFRIAKDQSPGKFPPGNAPRAGIDGILSPVQWRVKRASELFSTSETR
jgi:hypothetical protein